MSCAQAYGEPMATPGLRQSDIVVMDFRFHKDGRGRTAVVPGGTERLHFAARSAERNPTVLRFAKGEPLL